MAQLNFTINMDELVEAVSSSNMDQVMKSMAVMVFNAYMEAQRDAYIAASRYERTDGRKDYRNGYYERQYTLKVGTITLKVPRTRSGNFSTDLFERYQRMDQALVIAMIEMYVNGVSTQRVGKLVETLCGKGASKQMVSTVLEKLDPAVYEFKGRSLTHSRFDYMYVDAMYIKVRENSRIVSKAVYIAQGINEDNKREILGFMIDDEESTVNWTNFFLDLKARGLSTPKLIISDAHPGIKAAVKEVFLTSTWQRCTVHFKRNIMDTLPKKGLLDEKKQIKDILDAPSQAIARQLKSQFEEDYGEHPKFQKAIKCLDDGFEDAIQYMLEPNLYHVSIRTTNSLERLNQEIRRRERVIGIFPSVQSAERLIGAVLLDIHDSWCDSNKKFLKEYK